MWFVFRECHFFGHSSKSFKFLLRIDQILVPNIFVIPIFTNQGAWIDSMHWFRDLLIIGLGNVVLYEV